MHYLVDVHQHDDDVFFCEVRRRSDDICIARFKRATANFPHNFLTFDGKEYLFASPFPMVEVFIDCQTGEIWEDEICGQRELLEWQCLESPKILLQRVRETRTKRRREYWEFYDFSPEDGFMKLKESVFSPLDGCYRLEVRRGDQITTPSKSRLILDRDKEYIVYTRKGRQRGVMYRQDDQIVYLNY